MSQGDLLRELTQLISAAHFYLDMAEKARRRLSQSERGASIQVHAAKSSVALSPVPLSQLDKYFAHLASASVRLATIHEILVGSDQTRREAYPDNSKIDPTNIRQGISQGLEILLRDNIGHREIPRPNERGRQMAAFRQAALRDMTPTRLSPDILTRFLAIAEIVRKHKDSSSPPKP